MKERKRDRYLDKEEKERKRGRGERRESVKEKEG